MRRDVTPPYHLSPGSGGTRTTSYVRINLRSTSHWTSDSDKCTVGACAVGDLSGSFVYYGTGGFVGKGER